MKCPVILGLSFALSTVVLAEQVDVPASIDQQTLPEWMEVIRPQPDEGDWAKIPWRTAFWEAVVEAQAAEKPILLWAMNGHPLACT